MDVVHVNLYHEMIDDANDFRNTSLKYYNIEINTKF